MDAVGTASVCAGAGPAQQIRPTTDALARHLTNPFFPQAGVLKP